ncbi:transcriptional regulator [Rhodovarius lipocyclicus]|uniref:transcriptional regulator n=1 Tax=Rhodovarius lipocyclicus TaxID=268410 RepID=UPI0013590987|nr:transcriptional regulator [Rhodovarius lipocyclicus]
MTSTEPLTLAGVYARLNRAVREAGSQTAFAAQHGLSLGHLNDVLNSRREPGPLVLRALGLRKREIYVELSKPEVPA